MSDEGASRVFESSGAARDAAEGRLGEALSAGAPASAVESEAPQAVAAAAMPQEGNAACTAAAAAAEAAEAATAAGPGRTTKRPRSVPASRVALVHSAALLRAADSVVPQLHRGRMHLWAALSAALGLLQHPRLKLVEPRLATREELLAFHDASYLDAVQFGPRSRPPSRGAPEGGDASVEGKGACEDCGLGEDCPWFPGLWEHCCLTAGASLCAADELVRGTADIAINWAGGRHHARADRAAGFCCVNDVVLAVLHMQRRFARVLYVDLDVHHGDGVQEAFWLSEDVFTLSFHVLARGFYPGTGSSSECGQGPGRFRCLNVPLRPGAQDETFVSVVPSVVTAVAAVFRPTAVVVQCGCDGLADDPVARDGLTLTTRGFGAVVRRLVEHFRRERLPVLLLGGGGYDPANAARCWSILTAVALGVEALPRQVPDHALLMHYAPAFELHSSAPPPTAARDGNDKAYLQRLVAFVKRFCELARSDTRQAQVGGADKGHAGDQPPSSGEKATALSARPQEEPLEGERE